MPVLRHPPLPRRATSALAALVALAALLALPATARAQDAANPGAGPFVDVSAAAGIAAPHRAVWDPDGAGEGYLAMGQAWGDYDGDGDLDLYLTGNRADNTLLRNRGDGSFEPAPEAAQVALPGVESGGALWSDLDGDGWPDLVVLNHGPNALFRNLEGRGFEDVTAAAGVGDAGKGTSATTGDWDGDGDLDLYVVNWACTPECEPERIAASRDRLYRNDGFGTGGGFSDVTGLLAGEGYGAGSEGAAGAKTDGAGFAASFFDYDRDGDVDLYVVNDKYRNPIGNVLWRNDGAGCGGWCWRDASAEAGAGAVMHGMGLAVGDLDDDGAPDLYASNMMGPMALLRGSGDGGFADVAMAAGVGVNPPGTAVGWGAAFLDYDNDGRQDLYLATSGMPRLAGSFYGGTQPDMEDFRRPYPDALFRNLGGGAFERVPAPDAGDGARPSMGLAYADYDDDGFVDLVVGIWNEGYVLYRNVAGDPDGPAAGNGWLTVDLVGGGPVNRDAVGARATLVTSDGRSQTREVVSGSSLGAGHDLRLHFGLGGAEPLELTVRWPDGLETVHAGLEAGRTHTLRYPDEDEEETR